MTTESKKLPVFPLRLPRSTRSEAAKLAARQRLSLNEFIARAIYEKIDRLELLDDLDSTA